MTSANEMMAAVNVSSGTTQRIIAIAPLNGSGDAIVACNSASDLREVIETAPGHDVRNFEMSSTTRDASGVLYAVWNYRPNGVGGGNSNATPIFLSVSLNGDRTWSAPQSISPKPSSATMNDGSSLGSRRTHEGFTL